MGAKRAAPGNYPTRCFVPLCRSGILDPLNRNKPITRRNVRGSRLFNVFCGHPRAGTNIAGLLGTIQSGSPTVGTNTPCQRSSAFRGRN